MATHITDTIVQILRVIKKNLVKKYLEMFPEIAEMKESIDRTKEDQNDIHYVTGENIVVVSSSFFLKFLRKKGLEANHMVDPVDEYTVHQLKESNGKKLNTKNLNISSATEVTFLNYLRFLTAVTTITSEYANFNYSKIQQAGSDRSSCTRVNS